MTELDILCLVAAVDQLDPPGQDDLAALYQMCQELDDEEEVLRFANLGFEVTACYISDAYVLLAGNDGYKLLGADDYAKRLEGLSDGMITTIPEPVTEGER